MLLHLLAVFLCTLTSVTAFVLDPHLKAISLALRPNGYPMETQAIINKLLPKVAV